LSHRDRRVPAIGSCAPSNTEAPERSGALAQREGTAETAGTTCAICTDSESMTVPHTSALISFVVY
jgi:hypothetical protein